MTLTVVYSGRPRDHTTVYSVLFKNKSPAKYCTAVFVEVFRVIFLFTSNLTL